MKIELVKIDNKTAGYNLVPGNEEEMKALGSIREIYFWGSDEEAMKYDGINTDPKEKYVTKMMFLQQKYQPDFAHEQAAINERKVIQPIFPAPTYRCTLCHSTEVRMKMWENPNSPDKLFEPSQDEDDLKNCWCGRCETHVELEPIDEEPASEPQQIFVCSECGSSDVEIRQWVKPNEGDKLGGNDCPEREDCWCNSCEEHNSLEIKQVNPI